MVRCRRCLEQGQIEFGCDESVRPKSLNKVDLNKDVDSCMESKTKRPYEERKKKSETEKNLAGCNHAGQIGNTALMTTTTE